MHDTVLDYVRDAIARYDLDGDVLDIGGRDVNGTTRELFPDGTYTVVDINDAPNVDIVADAADLDLPDRFDVILCTGTLEHTDRAAEIVAAAYRHLLPGGAFVVTAAGPGFGPHSMHGDPSPRADEFYENVDPEMLNRWLSAAGFASWTTDVYLHDIRATAFRGR